MSRDVNEAFEILIGWLKPSESETQAAASHRASIESCLKTNFDMTAMFRTGSFGHGTSVSGYSDIDYFAVVPTGKLSSNSGYTLQKFKEALETRFPLTNVRINAPAIRIPFGGGSPNEMHEITPAYISGYKNGLNIYGIPDRANGWMNSSPTLHNAWVNQQNDRLGKKVKHLIRLVKYWNYLSDARLRSFYLELRVAEFAVSEPSIIYKLDLRTVFSRLVNKSLAAMQDPQGVSGYVHPCSDAWKPEAFSRLQTASVRAEKALESEVNGKIMDAFSWWDKVFFGKFPSYY